MVVKVSANLLNIYKENRRNYDMALMTLLDSFDNATFQRAFSEIDTFTLLGQKTEITIGASATEQIKQAFQCEEISEELINELLWIAVLLPEI